MNRRRFVQGALVAPSALAVASASPEAAARRARSHSGEPFRMKFAPHFGMFRHHGGDDPVDQLKFMADEGFRALEDNGMGRRSEADQERIAGAMQDLGMEMGVFVAHADFGNVTFASSGAEAKKRIEEDMRKALAVAKRANARWCTVVPGCYSKGLEWDYQTANVIDNLRARGRHLRRGRGSRWSSSRSTRGATTPGSS